MACRYANGGSTQHLVKLGIPTACAKTGVKHLHHLAQDYDVGVYFEANGHGTILFSDAAVAAVTSAAAAPGAPPAALELRAAVDLINQTVGDALSDLLVVLIVLARRGMDAAAWAALYPDLPNQLRKVVIRDRSVVQVTNAERTCTAPAALQPRIDAAVAKRTNARSFVRASGTEDVVRVYAEAATAEEAAALASEVCGLVYELCDGVGDPPK
jgi:phosphoacetylglucosamine mutase